MRYIALLPKLPPLTWTWLRVEKERGDHLPPWWYALGRLDYQADISYFYPVPIAWLILAFDAITRQWNWLRSRPSRYDRRVSTIRHRAHRLGYERGYATGLREIDYRIALAQRLIRETESRR